MASNYPASLDTTATLPAAAGVGANLSTFPHSALHGNADDAIIAIETALGTAPQGTLSTVKARLDKIAPYTGALTNWTPGWTQSATITKTVSQATYSRVGRQMTANINMTATSAGTAANAILIGLPVACATSVQLIGDVVIFDASSGLFNPFFAYMQGTSTFGLLLTNGTSSGVVTAFTIASGDILFACLSWEAGTD